MPLLVKSVMPSVGVHLICERDPGILGFCLQFKSGLIKGFLSISHLEKRTTESYNKFIKIQAVLGKLNRESFFKPLKSYNHHQYYTKHS